MPYGTLLFADNDPAFLAVRSEFLERSGYRVLKAGSPEEARQVLQKQHIDLAILDLRLTDDTDAEDTSGFDLAVELSATVPKIMLTAFPTMKYVREGLRRNREGGAIVSDFIAKSDGPDSLVRAVHAVMHRFVLLVHGHDSVAKEEMIRFIENLGLHAIVLHERLKAGHTLIERFEDYANVGFAVVLLAPDDYIVSFNKPEETRARARQNVVFELGYLIGKLGRDKVAALFKENVEIPSDVDGALYMPMDVDGSWQLKLAREMKASGMDIDLNQLVEQV